MTGLICFLFILAFDYLALAVEAWVLTKMWVWFVVTTFSLPVLSVPMAAGLALTMNVLMPWTDPTDSSKKGADTSWSNVLSVVIQKKLVAMLRALIMLAIGAVIHSWWIAK
jgi:hypothetical protein